EGIPGGRLIMGRSLAEVVTPALARMTGQSLRIETGPVAAQEMREIDLRQHRDTLAMNPRMIDAVTPLDDLWGREVARLHVAMERPIQGVLSEARFYLLIATLIIGFLFCAIGL